MLLGCRWVRTARYKSRTGMNAIALIIPTLATSNVALPSAMNCRRAPLLSKTVAVSSERNSQFSAYDVHLGEDRR